MSNYMFPANPSSLSDEQYLLEVSQFNFPSIEEPIIQQDHLFQQTSLPSSTSSSSWKNQSCDPPMQLPPSNPNYNKVNDSVTDKKIVHKVVERRRRQEMNALYASLRSLLPREYLRGKRSISDHMGEAKRYIKQLEKRIQELGVKREMLKSFNNAETTDDKNAVTVRECWPGVEVVIDGSCWGEGLLMLRLSRVLEALVEEGFDVVSCIANKVNKSSVYTLQCEVNNNQGIRQNMSASVLQKKLMDLVQLESSWTTTQ